MTFVEIKNLISSQMPDAVMGEDLTSSPNALIIDGDCIFKVCELLHTNENTYFDMLSCITGIDNGPENGTLDVIYNLYSIPFDLHLMIKASLNREIPEIDSVSSIWRTANWHERETFDLLGIKFKNHPDLRRILLPQDWEGHPLRADYQMQEKYHGMTVAYDRLEESEEWKEER